MMKNTQRLRMSLKHHLENVIVRHIYLQPFGSSWINHLKNQPAGGNLIWNVMITTLTQLRFVVHC